MTPRTHLRACTRILGRNRWFLVPVLLAQVLLWPPWAAVADDFVWQGTCGTTDWHDTCAGGWCDPDYTKSWIFNNWGWAGCGEVPFPWIGDTVSVAGASVTMAGFADVLGVYLGTDEGEIGVGGEIILLGASLHAETMLIHRRASLTTHGLSVLDGDVLNLGTVVVTQGNTLAIEGTLRNAGMCEVQGGGFTLCPFPGCHGGLFRNEAPSENNPGGTILVPLGSPGGSIGVPVVNNGTVDVRAGCLALGAVTSVPEASYIVAPGATLYFTGPLTGVFTGSPAGTLGATDTWSTGPSGATLDFGGTGFYWDDDSLTTPGEPLTNAATGILRIAGGNLQGTIVNQGFVSQLGSYGFSNGALRNQGTYSVDRGGIYGGGVFENEAGGTILVPQGSPGGSIGVPVVNNGTVDVRAGTLSLGGGVTTAPEASYIVPLGASLQLAGRLTGVFTGSPAGTLGAGTDWWVGPSAGTLNFAGATLNFGGTGFYWWGGTLTTPGEPLTNGATGVLRIGGGVLSGTIVNQGYVSQVGGYSFANGTLRNQGTYEAQAGWISSQSPTDLFENEAGGTILVPGPGGWGVIGVPFVNAGRVEAQTGSLQFGNSFNQIAGAVVLSGGALACAQPLNMHGGQFAGIGTATADVNNAAGVVSPGAGDGSAGSLAVNGAYTQGADGSLNVELGGTQEAQYDRLTVTGTATLDGAVVVSLIEGFHPHVGDRFQILTCGSRSGQFSSVVTNPGVALDVELEYNPTNVTLVVLGVASPADFDWDGDVDLSDFAHFQTCFNGPNRPPAATGCGDADLDTDNDVDLSDFGVFQSCFNGPNRPPRCP